MRVAGLDDSSGLGAEHEGRAGPGTWQLGTLQAPLGPRGGAAGSGSSMEGWRQGWGRKENAKRRREWEAGVSQQLRTRDVEKHSQQFLMEKRCPLPGL